MDKHQIKPQIFENWINNLYQLNKDKEIAAALNKYKLVNKDYNEIFVAFYNNRIGNQKENITNSKKISAYPLSDMILSESYLKEKDTMIAIKHFDRIINKLRESANDNALQDYEIYYYDDYNSIIEPLKISYLDQFLKVYQKKNPAEICIIANAIRSAFADEDRLAENSLIKNKYLFKPNFKDRFKVDITESTGKQILDNNRKSYRTVNKQ